MARMLIADDNAEITDILRTFAEAEGYEVTTASNGTEALRAFHATAFDIILLDVMMPGKDGFTVCKEIRSESNIPILMITARSEDHDRIMGLDIGADDYIVKPFSPAEVMARTRAVLRRLDKSAGTNAAAGPAMACGTLTVNLGTCQASMAGNPIPLTKKELDLLWLLMEKRGRAFSRDQLLDQLWGWDYVGGTRTVDTHIKRLRAKLDKFPHPEWQIKTIWGVGYAFEEMP